MNIENRIFFNLMQKIKLNLNKQQSIFNIINIGLLLVSVIEYIVITLTFIFSFWVFS